MASTLFDTGTVITADWLNDVDEAVYNPSSIVLSANSIINVPAGNIAATDVQTALNELDTDKATSSDITSAVAAHAAAADPHPGYVTTAEGAALITAHKAESDPHPTYTTAAELAAAIAAIPAPSVSGIGSSQTWQDVSGSRDVGTVYQNTTGKPIMVSAVDTAGGNNVSVGVTSTPVTVTFGAVIIPNLWYYVLPTNGGATTSIWAELR